MIYIDYTSALIPSKSLKKLQSGVYVMRNVWGIVLRWNVSGIFVVNRYRLSVNRYQ